MSRKSKTGPAKRRLTLESLERRLCLSPLADAFEPDDSWQAARVLPTNGTPQPRSIHASANQDWATFALTAASRVTLQTDGSAGDTYLRLYDAGDTARPIASDDDSGAGSFSRIETALDPGTYYVQVTAYSQSATIDAYTLSATAVPLRQLMDAFEADDTSQTARTLPTNGTIQNRSIHRPTDVDWARFTLAEASRVTLVVANPSNIPELNLYAAADLNRSLSGARATSDGSLRVVVYLDPGTYYAKLNDAGQNNFIDAYTLSATAVSLRPFMDAFEADNTPQTARTLLVNGTVQNRTLHRPTDVDWAKFILTTASRVTIQTDGPSGDTRLRLYAAADTTRTIASDDDSGNGSFSRIETTLDPGTYYVQVDEYGEDAPIEAYTLSATALPLRQFMDAFEADDTSPAARRISAGAEPQVHSIHRPTDVDWVKFTLAAAGEIVLQGESSGPGLAVSLYAAADTEHSIATGYGSSSRIVKPLAAGTYYARIEDSGQDQWIDRYTLALSFYPPANLAVTTAAATPASGLALGAAITVNWAVSNLGSGTADPGHNNNAYWTDSVYLSTDRVLSSDDDYLGSWYSDGALAPQASYSASGQFTLPRDARWAGRTAYLLVKTDVDGRVNDSYAANNLRAVAVRFNQVVDLQSPGPGRYTDPQTPIRLAALAYDYGGPAVVDIALDTDSSRGNGPLRWLAEGLSVTNSSTPLEATAALAGLTPRTTPYYLWARVRRSAGGAVAYTPALPITVASVAAMSDDQTGEAVGGSGYEVFGLDAARFNRSVYFTVRTNFPAQEVGRGGDLRFVVGGTAYGLAVNTHPIAGGGEVVAGDLYRGAAFKFGTTVTTVPTFIDSYTARVSGRSAVKVVPTPTRPWKYEIQGRVDLAGFAGYRPGDTVEASWSMFCGNDTDEVTIQPEDPDLQIVSAGLNNGRVEFSLRTIGTLTSATVGLFESADDQWDPEDRSAAPPQTLSVTSAGTASGAFDMPAALQDDTRYLIVVADPSGAVRESSETNNAKPVELQFGEIHPEGVTWNEVEGRADGSLTVDYTVTAALRPGSQTPISLYWAKGPTGLDALPYASLSSGTPRVLFTYTVDASQGPGTYEFTVPKEKLTTAPLETTHLLVVADPAKNLASTTSTQMIYATAAHRSDLTAAQLQKLMPGLGAADAARFVGPLNQAMSNYGIQSLEQRAMFLAQIGHESQDLTHWAESRSQASCLALYWIGAKWTGLGASSVTSTGITLRVPAAQNAPATKDFNLYFAVGTTWTKNAELISTVTFTKSGNVYTADFAGAAPSKLATYLLVVDPANSNQVLAAINNSLGNWRPDDAYDFRGRGPVQLTGRYIYQLYANYAQQPTLMTNPGQLSDSANPQLGIDSAGWYWNNYRKLNTLVTTQGGKASDAFNIAVTRLINPGEVNKATQNPASLEAKNLADRLARYRHIRAWMLDPAF